MNPGDLAEIGEAPLAVTILGLGGAPIGSFPSAVTEEAARSALEVAWDSGIRYFDTAPWYGLGLSEHRIGSFLRTKPRSEFVVSTKVGRVLRAWPNPELPRLHRGSWAEPLDFELHFDYSYDGVMRSYEDSLQRLGMGRVDALTIHDLDRRFHEKDIVYEGYLSQLISSGYRALRDLKSAGKIRAFGAGVNVPGVIPQFLDLFELDYFLVASPYTLVDQGILDTELARCVEAGVSVIIGSAFRGGILAFGTKNYRPGGPVSIRDEEIERARRIEEVCDDLGVPLAAAAIQFPLAHPAVKSVLFGAVDAEQVRQAVIGFAGELPVELWSRLKAEGLVVANAPVPQPAR